MPLTVALLLASSAPLAQPAKRDPAAADALFQEARALVRAGNDAAGCPKFEASLALKPSASTMLNIAKCYERAGKIATAWQQYGQALTLSRDTQGDERRKELERIAEQGIHALEPRLPRLRVVVAMPPAGLRVLRDTTELPVATLGSALPADPGVYEVSISAPGYRTEKRSVTLEPGKTAVIEITLKAAADADAASITSGKEPSPRGVPAWVWATGGVGLALVGAGVYFLADDLSAISALRANCHREGPETYCAPGYDYQSDNERKDRGLYLAIGLGGVGAVAVGAAVAGAVLAPSAARQTAPQSGMRALPWVTPWSAGILVSEVF